MKPMADPGELTGKVALVTGASRGIGAAIASRLARAGAKVAVNYHFSRDAAASVVDDIRSEGGEALLLEGDVSQDGFAESAVKQVIDKWQRIDILVNNAGINRDRLLLRMTPDEWDQVLEVNLRGAFLCTKYVLPHLIRQHSGRVVNISSVVGLAGNAGQPNYAASKAGLLGFTKSLARELAPRNITVNAVAPGLVPDTGMTTGLGEEAVEQLLSHVPLGRPGSGRDVAAAVAFLASEEAAYITGHVLTVDGGMTM